MKHVCVRSSTGMPDWSVRHKLIAFWCEDWSKRGQSSLQSPFVPSASWGQQALCPVFWGLRLHFYWHCIFEMPEDTPASDRHEHVAVLFFLSRNFESSLMHVLQFHMSLNNRFRKELINQLMWLVCCDRLCSLIIDWIRTIISSKIQLCRQKLRLSSQLLGYITHLLDVWTV